MEIIALVILLFIALGLQGALFRNYFFHRLDYSCTFSAHEAHEGDEIYFIEEVHNKKLLPLPWLKADIHSSRWLDFAGAHSVITQESRHVTSTFFLKSFQKTTRRWKLKCLKRGVFETENVTLTGGDLLGNNVMSIPVNVGASLVVYPQTLNLEELLVPVNYLQGETIVKRWILEDPFVVSGAREYRSGDPMNRIHWSATAREGGLMVRKNDFTSETNLTILLNIQSREFEPDSVVDRDRIELGIKVAATLLDRALKMSLPVRLGTNGCTLDENSKMVFTGEASGRAHVGELLKILAKLKLRNIRDFEDFLDEHKGKISNSDVAIITSYTSEGILGYARGFNRSGNRVKLIVLNPHIEVGDLPHDLETYILKQDGE